MEDILKRLGNVEADVSELKLNVNTVMATIPHLATKADVKDLRTEMEIQFGSLRADMSAQNGSLRAEMAARETAFIKWMIATVLTAAGLAFTFAKFVH
ncbi:MAG: hypothetical protein JSR66_05405 [Proteobacteria bacterium]|nr:hypothetical protein [Pseudomonadota bacterium]